MTTTIGGSSGTTAIVGALLAPRRIRANTALLTPESVAAKEFAGKSVEPSAVQVWRSRGFIGSDQDTFPDELEPMLRPDRTFLMENDLMEHDEKIWATAGLLLERYGRKAPHVARGWSKDLAKRHEAAAAARCLEIVDAAKKLVALSAAREPRLAEVMSGAVTGQMMRADRVERGEVERLMNKVKRRHRG
jgi:hypothetical protein